LERLGEVSVCDDRLGTTTFERARFFVLVYRSGKHWNEPGFANSEFDTLLHEAVSIADADQRREGMARLQTIMQDEGVIIQPFRCSIYRHQKENVVGFEMHPTLENHVTKLDFAA